MLLHFENRIAIGYETTSMETILGRKDVGYLGQSRQPSSRGIFLTWDLVGQ